jgi:hypothetical protein
MPGQPRNDVSYESAYSQALASRWGRLRIGHVTSAQQPPMGPSYPPAFRQMYPGKAANVPHRPHHFNFAHLQNPGPMTAASSHYQDLAGVQHTIGGPYYQQLYFYPPFLVAISN